MLLKLMGLITGAYTKVKAIKINPFVGLVFLLALTLRWFGINHDLPYVLHPDEPTIVQTALGLRFNINPEHFDWPSLLFYLNYFLFMGFAALRKILEIIGVGTFLPFLREEPAIFYLLSRLLSSLLGALTVIPLYLAGKELLNKNVGYLAALGIALAPFHVWHSHYNLIDVPMVFFISWGLYFGLKILKNANWINYFWSGLFIGLAASTKYNGGLVCLLVPLAHFIRVKRIDLEGIKLLVISGLAAATGFLVGTPFSVLDYETFSRTDGPKGAFWQFANVGKVPFLEQIAKFTQNSFSQLPADMGYVPYILFLAGFILTLYWLIKRKTEKALVLLMPAFMGLFLLFYISGFDKSRSHYYMTAYPFVFLVSAYVLNLLLEKTKKRFIRILIVVWAFALPAYFSIVNVIYMAQPETRVTLFNWADQNIPANEPIYYNSSQLKDGLVGHPLRKVEFPIKKGIRDASGYFVVLWSPEMENQNLFPALKKESVVLTFEEDNFLRRGPIIKVYKFNAND